MIDPMYFRIALVVTAYWSTSISMVFLNKYLLNSESLQLDAPFFITFAQCFVAVCICYLLSGLTYFFPRIFKFPSTKIDALVSRDVLPLSFCYVMMLIFNNLSLRNLGVAFYNVGRSMTTCFNILLSYMILKKKTSYESLLCCAIIIIGFLLGVDVEKDLGSISYSGVGFGICASFFVSLSAIYTSKVLPTVGGNVMRLTFYNNLNALVLLIPVLFLSSDLKTLSHFKYVYSPAFWCTLIFVGICGVAVGYTVSMQIQVTSPLTHNISGTAKASVQTIIAVVFFHLPKTALWWFSNFLVLLGSFLYAFVKGRRMKTCADPVRNDGVAGKV